MTSANFRPEILTKYKLKDSDFFKNSENSQVGFDYSEKISSCT